MTDQQAQAIRREVFDLIERTLAASGYVKVDWIVHAVVSGWEQPGGRNWDKWVTCGYANVRQVARQVIRRFQPGTEDPEEQLTLALPGYKKLHRAYLVERDSARVIVATEHLTVGEAEQVLSEIDRNVKGLLIHAVEMRRYIEEVLKPRTAAVVH